MKKIMTAAFIIFSSVNMASADSYNDTWDAFKSESKSYEANDSRSSKNRKERTNTVVSYSGGEQGIASFYWQPQAVACGGRFNPSALTAAHKTLPCGSKVKVTNTRNNKSVIVTINDRGPFVSGRVIDLSKAAASEIGMIGSGLTSVRLDRL